MLGLRGNGITVPPKGALAALQSIQDLRLDDNNITVIGKDAFGQMRVLSKLSLSRNKVFWFLNINLRTILEKILETKSLWLNNSMTLHNGNFRLITSRMAHFKIFFNYNILILVIMI